MSFEIPPVTPPQRVLLGPGPSDVPPRVLSALAAPTIGHLDPQYLKIMDETRADAPGGLLHHQRDDHGHLRHRLAPGWRCAWST